MDEWMPMNKWMKNQPGVWRLPQQQLQRDSFLLQIRALNRWPSRRLTLLRPASGEPNPRKRCHECYFSCHFRTKLVSHLVINREEKEESQIRNPLIFYVRIVLTKLATNSKFLNRSDKRWRHWTRKKPIHSSKRKKKVFGVVERAQGLTNTI